jgi:FSR family fosmidomycin resistance protein-like MFS transporter
MFIHPVGATLLAGIGNALFHVGGGIVSLNLKPGKASMPGVFVAPGGIGLFVGSLLMKTYESYHEVFIILLLCMGLVIMLLKRPPIFYAVEKATKVNYLVLTILLLMITICIRSAVGLSIHFPWKSKIALQIILILCIALGKGIGGFLADSYGWIKITVGSLAISALLLFFGAQIPVTGIAGLFLFNITMPVTLVAISNILPGRPGFSFGLSTLALVTGSLPTFSDYETYLSDTLTILILVSLSAAILFIGLRLYNIIKSKI